MFPGIDRKQAAAESLRNCAKSWINHLFFIDNKNMGATIKSYLLTGKISKRVLFQSISRIIF